MKKFLFLAFLLLAYVASNAQCLTSISYDTTSTSTMIYFTKTSAVKKVGLYFLNKADDDTVAANMPLMSKYYTTSPIVLDQSLIAPGDSFNARLKGIYSSDSVVCTSNNFVFRTPHYTVDSCSTPGGLKAFVAGGKAYLSWNSGFCSTYTVLVTEVGGSTTTYSSVPVCQKAVPIVPNKTYTWTVKANCTGKTKISEKGLFSTPQNY